MSPSESNSEYDIQISVDADLFPIDPDRLRALVGNVLSQFEVVCASVDIAIVDDPAIMNVHEKYLGVPKTTDVISFDLSDDRQAGRCFEIIINAEEAARQAQQRGHTPQAELALYIVHGLLHNLGYDDASAEQSEHMHRMEDQILQQNGCGRVYYRASNQ